MIDRKYCQQLARYNQWMKQRLYAVCAEIPDKERKANRGAFFNSIHATLSHIMYGDLAFLSRFTGEPAEVPQLGKIIHEDFERLQKSRTELDQRIIHWAGTLTSDWLALETTYISKVDGKQRTVPNWLLVTHMFNHETHHSGQITTLLSQMGLDMGTTDLPFMPGFETDSHS